MQDQRYNVANKAKMEIAATTHFGNREDNNIIKPPKYFLICLHVKDGEVK